MDHDLERHLLDCVHDYRSNYRLLSQSKAGCNNCHGCNRIFASLIDCQSQPILGKEKKDQKEQIRLLIESYGFHLHERGL